MDEHINSVLLLFLDTETKFHYLDYHYHKMLDKMKQKKHY